MKNFLVLTDFSANATHAAAYCFHISGQMHANMVLCNVIEEEGKISPSAFVAWPMEGDDILEDLSDMKLFELKSRLANQKSRAYQPNIGIINAVGKLEDVLPEIVESRNIDITVMGTHENDGVKKFFLSNHNQAMILQTTTPLLLVPPIAAIGDIVRIAFATDLTHVQVDLEHILTLVALARNVNAEILIVHVGAEEKLPDVVQYENERLLTEISNKANYPKIYYRLLTNKSREEGLQWLCDNENISILALAPRKRSFIARLMSAGLTKSIARHLSIPLLILPPG
jgi:nucleotide-binding universal stress UspA family protein